MVTHANGRKEPIHVGATGPRMLKLSGALAYGVILMNGVDRPPRLATIAPRRQPLSGEIYQQ